MLHIQLPKTQMTTLWHLSIWHARAPLNGKKVLNEHAPERIVYIRSDIGDVVSPLRFTKK
uniref:Uncharacterized protein n=1 Tax=Rhizophora mucronata TaxID=61149 RepID=A0A2P2NIK7_RHIMU